MGSQIQFIQSSEDEIVLNEVIRQNNYTIHCLPRLMEKPLPSPVPLAQAKAQSLVLFSEKWEGKVLESITALTNDPDVFHVYPYGNLCIQWYRTIVDGTEFGKGRYYYDPDPREPEFSTKELKKLFGLISRYITENYPVLHPLKLPIYVGPHIWKMIREGKATAVFKKGHPMPLEPNPRFKG